MTTDTRPPPTDPEIAALRSEFGITSNGRGIKEFTQVRDFARAVLDKWGQPAHSGEPVAWLHKNRLGEVQAFTSEPPPILKAKCQALYTAQPVEREPLTEAQVQALIEAKHYRPVYELKASDQVCLDWYRLGLRDGEAAHGINAARARLEQPCA